MVIINAIKNYKSIHNVSNVKIYLQIMCFVIRFIVIGGVCNERLYDSY